MKIQPICKDILHRLKPDEITLRGLLGDRFEASRINRLHPYEEDFLLFPYHQHLPIGYDNPLRPRPEIHGDWQGEFIGHWIDAAVLTAWNTHDDILNLKIDRIVSDWISTQEPSGYLGVYDEIDRWRSWDVLVLARGIMGLLSYFTYTHNEIAINAAIKIADYILSEFGPGRRFLHSVGPDYEVDPEPNTPRYNDQGMASSSILEPIVWLYLLIGDQRYLEFGKWLVDIDWESPGGAHILSSLFLGQGVAGIANGKANEMLMCLNGLVDLYRATSEQRYLDAVLIAWNDIVAHHLYITGSASTREFFTKDYVLQNEGIYRLCENCVAMEWMYLNFKLGRLLGESRFYDLAERTLYNHFLGAQSPDGRGWAYYTGLRDSKRYRWHIDPECCPSRGIRGLAITTQEVFHTSDDGLYINLYESAVAQISLPRKGFLVVDQKSDFPFDGDIGIELKPESPMEFCLYLRVPGWCRDWQVSINGKQYSENVNPMGYICIKRIWNPNDVIRIILQQPVRSIGDNLGNFGRFAIMRGPLVYAMDTGYLPEQLLMDDIFVPLNMQGQLVGAKIKKNCGINSTHIVIPAIIKKSKLGQGAWMERERYFDILEPNTRIELQEIELVPFFEAGNIDPGNYRHGLYVDFEPVTKFTYQVWLPIN